MTPNVAVGLALASAILIGGGFFAGHYHGKAETLNKFVNYNVAMMEKLK